MAKLQEVMVGSIDLEALTRLHKENKRLRAFAEFVICVYCWGCSETDCGDIQEKAEELGLIELREVSPEDSIDGEDELYFLTWEPKASEADDEND